MTWSNEPDDIEKYQGFVYCITHNDTGKFYIGKKFFWNKRTRKPLKGRKNRRHYRVESDWKTYWGSSTSLKEDVKKFGKKAFTRTILSCHETKWDCAYFELLEQINRNVLFSENSYNEIVNVRLRRRKT